MSSLSRAGAEFSDLEVLACVHSITFSGEFGTFPKWEIKHHHITCYFQASLSVVHAENQSHLFIVNRLEFMAACLHLIFWISC